MQASSQRTQLLFGLLEELVANNIVSAKYAFIVLLRNITKLSEQDCFIYNNFYVGYIAEQ